MSAELQELFKKFINKFENDLVIIDQQYTSGSEKDECTKNAAKLEVYERFTVGLKDKGEYFLKIIRHLNDDLAHMDSGSESASTEQIVEDMDFIRKCLESRVQCEEEAINSLTDLEDIFAVISRENQRLSAENQLLKSNQKSDTVTCEEIATNVIDSLKHENQELKDVIKRNKETIRMLASESGGQHDENKRNYEIQLAALKTQLKEKNKTIELLKKQIKNLNSPPSTAHSSNSNYLDNISDVEKSDNEKLRMFQNGYKELTMVLKEKYEQLREQRTKMADLKEKLAECAANGNEADKKLIAELNEKIGELHLQVEQLNRDCGKSNADIVKMQSQKDQMTGELTELQSQNNTLNQELMSMKQFYEQNIKQIEECAIELREMKQREELLARKFALQENHMTTLRDERTHLLSLDNEMLHSIAICKRELAKYKIDSINSDQK